MKRKMLIAFTALTLSGAVCAGDGRGQTLYQPLSADVTPQLSEPGNAPVGVKTITISMAEQPVDLAGSKAERSLKLEIWYPAAEGGQPALYANQTRSGKSFVLQGTASRDARLATPEQPFPLVVLSHGYTGYRTIMYYLGEHLASHGYIVAGIDHTGSTNADVDMKNAPYAGFPNTLLNRSRDQVHTLQAVLQHREFGPVTDPSAAGLVGYSMGGYGAVNTVGGCYDFDDAAVARLTGADDDSKVEAIQAQLNTCAGGAQQSDAVDKRWKAMVAMAPWGGQLRVFDADRLATIAVPSLYIAGEYDDISGYDGIRWLYTHTTSAPAYLLTVHNARHNIAAHPAPAEAMETELDLGHYYEPAWRTQALNAINEHFVLAMMNCYVKQSAQDCDYLAVRGSSAQQPENGETPPPWTGFDNRFALGLSMEANAAAEQR